jgi:iron complex transport system substrate-binding protein
VRASPIAGERGSCRQRSLFLALAALAPSLALAAGCRGEARGQGARVGSIGAAAPIAEGRPGPPRVVSLHDLTTEIVVALHAASRLVGVTPGVQLPAEVARAVAGVPEVGGVESIVKVRPTVVLGTDVVAERSPELVSYLRGRGVEVWLARPARLEDVFEAVEQVARRIGEPERARPVVEGLKARVAAVRPGGGAPLPVFVYDCCDPAFTAAGRTVITDVIARAGGRNVFADLDADWTKVSWEEVVARRPRLVVIHDYRYGDQTDVAGKRAQLRGIRALAGLPTAVLPLGLSLGGIRSVDALERLAPILAEAAGR